MSGEQTDNAACGASCQGIPYCLLFFFSNNGAACQPGIERYDVAKNTGVSIKFFHYERIVAHSTEVFRGMVAAVAQ